jgi:hypothetical protein
MTDAELEARARLGSVLEICQHEAEALENLHDPRVASVLLQMRRLQAEIIAALASLAAPPRTATELTPFALASWRAARAPNAEPERDDDRRPA